MQLPQGARARAIEGRSARQAAVRRRLAMRRGDQGAREVHALLGRVVGAASSGPHNWPVGG
eukprot:7182679-Alexandrium_andersonii.AAC.1